MHRLIVALLATVDAVLAVAVGLAATLAPLTLLWVFGLGGTAEWGALWPAGVAVWQFGNLVPLAVTLPADYLAATGIDAAGASFTLSLAPLAFAGFTAIFAARSGARASRADAWVTGVLTGTAVFAGLATAVALTSGLEIARVETWQAIGIPTLLFAGPALVAAVVTEWCEAAAGVVARLRDRIERAPHGWGHMPGLVARGGAVVTVGLVGLGGAVTAVALLARAGQVVALFQAGNVDALGATVLTLAQLAYLPTLVVWGMSFAVGPGFSLGAGTAVSPAGTQAGVVPGIPMLGAIPESTTSWLLLLALVPIALGAFAGWIARSRVRHSDGERMPSRHAIAPTPAVSQFDAARTTALEGLLSSSPVRGETPAEPDDQRHEHAADRGTEPIAARLVTAVGIAVLAAAAAALVALAASGSMGPGSLSHVGPAPGPVALAVGAEVFVGAAILLLSPRPRRPSGGGGRRGAAERHPDAGASAPGAPAAGALAAGAPAAQPDPSASGVGASAPRPVDRPRRPRAPAPQPVDSAASEATTEPIDLPNLPPGAGDGSE